jgi:hypothetical protein
MMGTCCPVINLLHVKVGYSPTQGFNLIQMSLNWTLDAHLKWAIRVWKHFFVRGHPINKPCHKRNGFEQPITLYSTLQRAQFYYWNLFSTTSIAWCCGFGVWAPQLTVSTSNFNVFFLSTYGCSSGMPSKLPFRHLGAWKHDREDKLHDCFIVFFKHIICSAASQNLAVVRQQGDY